MVVVILNIIIRSILFGYSGMKIILNIGKTIIMRIVISIISCNHTRLRVSF
jgi:hypothetical protein